MDFFKSLVSDDPENPTESSPDSDSDQENNNLNDSENDQVSDFIGGWNFGGLMQTLANRSESVIETYRRDLQEFGTGLKKETHIFREGAQGAIDGVIKSTAEIISHGKESLLSVSNEMETGEGEGEGESKNRVFSRFEAQLRGIQRDVRTYTEEVEDLEDFRKWKMGFALIDKGEEIEGLIRGEGEGELEGVYKSVVPSEVDNETFWLRYFYRVEKLEKKESVRAKLVRRAIEIDDEEELSWDVDDDEEDDDSDESIGEASVGKEKGGELDKKKDLNDQGSVEKEKGGELETKKDLSDQGSVGKEKSGELEKKEKGGGFDDKKDLSDQGVDVIEKEEDRKGEMVNESGENVGESKFNVESDKKENDVGLKSREEGGGKNEEELVKVEENSLEKKDEKVEKKDEKVEKNEEKVLLEGKGDEGGLVKEVGVSVHSSKEDKVEEEDLEWDEIGDVDSSDEKKTAASGEKSKEADLRKRLSTAEEDEDLSWDIEDDDDEPIKS